MVRLKRIAVPLGKDQLAHATAATADGCYAEQPKRPPLLR